MVVTQNISDAVNELNRRILPARLNQSDNKNLRIVLDWLDEGGFDQNTPSITIADFLEKKVKAVLFENKLVWDIQPKALAATKELTGPQRLQNPTESAAEFNARKAAGEAADAKKAKDADAMRQINEIVNSFQLIDHRTGRIAFGRTEAVKETLRKHVQKEIARNANLPEVAKVVAKHIAKIYLDDEKSRERV
jgi:hypothetical protein